jgi:hypothetical protein
MWNLAPAGFLASTPMLVSGIDEGMLLKLAGEPGHGFTEKFDMYKKFCRRENPAPDNKITGGRIISGHLLKRKNSVGQIFREAAVTVNTSKSPPGDSYRRMKSRRVLVGQLLQRLVKSAELFT